MKNEKPFELRVVPLAGGDYGVALFQERHGTAVPTRRPKRTENANGPTSPTKWEQVVWIRGTPFRAIVDQVLTALKRCGYKPSDLARTRQKPFVLTEQEGVRLGLLMMAVKPLRKVDRMEAVSAQVRAMGDEEAYYWFSKSTKSEIARRAQKSLRVLLARE
ncbi:MAG: hypothetical protein GX616_12465 [Planctomycetes bacterium]|nr:hypothetical protein [Planctomycetota bacterium]